jgi:hypothetical protein
LEEGDEVWVPVSVVTPTHPGFAAAHGGSVASGKLLGRVDDDDDLAPGQYRTWNVQVHGVDETLQISSRRLRRHVKVLILRLGDWETEQTALNPLAQSLKAQLSLLLPPNAVDVEYIRTLDELAGALRVHGGGLGPSGRRQAEPWGFALLVGHGRAGQQAAIRFGHNWHTAGQMAAAVRRLGPGRRSFSDARFISLCCETGDESFAKAFSAALTTTWLGPAGVLHAFEAAGFVQRLFFEHFLVPRLWTPAFTETRSATSTFSTSFRCWMNGDEV